MHQTRSAATGPRSREGLHGHSALPGWYPPPALRRALVEHTGTVTYGVIPGSSIGLGYWGGPVIGCPQIYVGFWGHDYYGDPGYMLLANRLMQFVSALPQSKFMNVLSQYGAGGGADIAGTFVQAHTLGIDSTLFTNQDIANWIQILIDFGVIPDASPPGSLSTNVMMIFLDDTIQVNDPNFLGGANGGIVMCEPSGDNAFGYHYYFDTNSGNPMYYAVIPALDDTCLRETCADDNYCTLHLSQTQEQRITIAASHEFAEMLTDPQPFTGWVPEIGDPCSGETDTMTVGSNTWTVQRIYSVEDDIASNGGNTCVSSKDQPLPAQHGGPFAGANVAARYRPGHLDRLLPLPMIYFDGATRKMEIRDRDLVRYYHRLAAPLPRTALPAHLPQLLRQLANAVEPGQRKPAPGQS
jgi:hypothetical protein